MRLISEWRFQHSGWTPFREQVTLTAPEVDKLCHLGERAWLQVATFSKGGRPRFCVIQGRISGLSPDVLYRQMQYLGS